MNSLTEGFLKGDFKGRSVINRQTVLEFIDNNPFTVYFQPIFSARDCTVYGYEALNCFARNSMQAGCVSDMVINKVGHIKLIIERAREENQCEQTAEILDMASKDIDGLINWVRYLQGETKGR